MRAMQLFMFILCLNGAIALVNSLGIFWETTFVEAQNEDYDYEVEDLNEFAVAGEPSIVDYTTMALSWLWESVIWIFKFIGAFVFIYPFLCDELMIPDIVSGFLQGLIYSIYAWGIIQWKSGRSIQQYY